MKFDVLKRHTDEVQFTADIDCDKSTSQSIKLKLAVRWGLKAKADLSGAYLRGADLSGADLSGADLSSADLSSAGLRGAGLRGADLHGADLSGAYLSGAYLSGADLSSAGLSGADLRGAYLSGTDLSGADLSGAYLSGAYLRGADLSGAYLRGADLSSTDLRGAYLSGADLRGVDPSGAYLDKVRGIRLQGNSPVLILSPIGSESGTLIAYKTNKGVYLSRGCFLGTIEDFRLAVDAKHGDNEHGVLYRAACVFIEQWATSTGNPTR